MQRKGKPAMLPQLLYGTIAGLLIGISALAIHLAQGRFQARDRLAPDHFTVESDAGFDGAIRIQPPIALPDFRLTDHAGAERTLSDLRGRYALLSFGFTNCPDICPLTLSDFQAVSDILGGASQRVAFVFISVDGRRDKPETLSRYLRFRNLHSIIGLTGAEERIREFGAPLGLAFEIAGDASAANYSVNHTIGAYLLDPRGRWIMRYPFGLPAETIAADLRNLLAK